MSDICLHFKDLTLGYRRHAAVHHLSGVVGGKIDVKGSMNPVPVTLLTGFLGSGKTTLLNEILRDPRMEGSAVIVNEFGAVSIDHDLVRTGSETYFETTTGCICCTATSDIRVSLYELHDARIKGQVPPVRRVIIETTGLADTNRPTQYGRTSCIL